MITDSSSRLLPVRGGSRVVNHCLTSFDHVVLPANALLGSLETSPHPHSAFMAMLWRVAAGSLAVASFGIPALQISAHIANEYSNRRLVTSETGSPVPIISFRTQQIPIVLAVANAFVMQSLHRYAVKIFIDETLDPRVRHGVAACAKAVMLQHSQTAHQTLSERCGAQGLFDYNQLSNQYVCHRTLILSYTL